MKAFSSKIFTIFLGVLFLSGCADNQLSSVLTTSNPSTPAEEILINNQQFNKPYRILGPVAYTLKSRSSLFSSQLDFREQAIDLLKQQTYAKYGDEVDAIIDTRVEESTTEDRDGKLNVTHIEGVAITFLADKSEQSKATPKSAIKRKHKSARKILVIKKIKPVKKMPERIADRPVKKPKVEDIEISPTEILK